jgi:uncharacterized membrane protein
VEDFFYLCLGFAVCSAPFVGIGFLITLLRRPEDRDARARLDAVETQLAWVRSEGAKLGQRVLTLEAREQELTGQLEEARRALASGVRAVETVGTSVATEAASTWVAERAGASEARGEAEAEAGSPTEAVAGAGTETAAGAETETAAGAETVAVAETATVAEAETGTAAATGTVAATETAPASETETKAASAAEHVSTPVTGAAPATAPPPVGPPSAPVPPPPPRDGEGWERWIGVRGAAALGASVLVVAALYFFQYSIEHGWIGPFMRVLLGLATGTACVVLSEWPLRRRYAGVTSGGVPLGATLANWLAGAGIAILYASSWAASGLYHLVPNLVSGVAMVAITAACAGLAVYRDSLAIAVLGLFGGFLTPIALSTGEDRPIPLFTYLFLLDGALLFLAQKKRWPSLAALALAFTAFYQLAWIFGRMDDATTGIGLVVTLAFAALFAGVTMLFPSRGEDEKEAFTNRLVRVAAVLTPFALAIAFAVQRGPLAGFGATLTLTCLLCAGATFVAVRDRLGWLAPAAASGAVGLLLIFGTSHHADPDVSWQSFLLAVLPTLLFQAAAEGKARGLAPLAAAQGLGAASVVAAGGATLLVGALALEHADTYGWWVGALAVLSTTLLRAIVLEGWSLALVLAALVHASIWTLWSLVWAERSEPVRLAVVTLLGIVHVAAYQGVALLHHRARGAAPEPTEGDHDEPLLSGAALAEGAAFVAAGLLLLSLVAADDLRAVHGALYAGATFVLGLFAMMPAMRVTSPRAPAAGLFALLAVLLVALVQGAFEASSPSIRALEADRWLRFGTNAAGVLVFTILPTLAPRLARTRWAWRTAAIAPMLWFPALHHGWTWAFGASFVGALPVLLALLTLTLVLAARARTAEDASVRTSAIVWLAGATMLFVTVAIPLQLDREWITIGWALEAAALLALYQRLDHPGLKWVAAGLFAAVCARLLLNPYVLGYYERSELRIFNWLTYTYLVPTAALVGGGWLLRDLEGERLRGWERAVLPAGWLRPVSATLYAAALVVGFAWLNLTIFDWYATGPALSIPMDRMPARDLTISIAWALYGLVVLALGMWRESTPMRITSLLLVLLTAAKVFLYDLSNLEDLYRVAALVGLALSLITISLAYQRFVFRKPRRATSTPEESP